MTGVRVCRRRWRTVAGWRPGDIPSRRTLMLPIHVGPRGRWRLPIAHRRSVLVSAGSSGRSQTALGIEQEHAGSDDLFAFSQALPDFDAIGQLDADGDGPRLEPVVHGDEDVLLHPRIDDGVARHGDDVLPG